MSLTLSLRFISGICLATLLSITVAPAYAVIDPPIVKISDVYPTLEIMPSGVTGPPQNDYATITYEDDNGIASWEMGIRTWKPTYVPSGPSDTGGSVDNYAIDSGLGDNPQKQKQYRPADIAMKGSGTVRFCFYTFGYGASGSYKNQFFHDETATQTYVQ